MKTRKTAIDKRLYYMLKREPSSSQEPRSQTQSCPDSPTEPTVVTYAAGSSDASLNESSFTAEGPPIYYGDRQRRNERRSGADQSFLYKARPSRGRL